MKSKHIKKLIAPVVITVLLICYFIFYGVVFVKQPAIPAFGKLLGVIVPLAMAATSVYLLFERINEVKKGEEDDLSKY